MARQFRRMRKDKKPVDWVANEESWRLDTPPFVMDPFANPSAGYAHSNTLACNLTFHLDMVDQNQEFGRPQLEQTAVRVVGDIHFGLHTFSVQQMPTVSLQLDLHHRVVVGTQVPDSVYGMDIDQLAYNMDLPWVANDDFLWHRHDSSVLTNNWWNEGLGIFQDWRSPIRIPVDIRVQRRLKQREILVLLMMVSQKGATGPAGVADYAPWADLRVWSQPCLRTLVRTIT